MSKKALKNDPGSWFPESVNILGTEYKCVLALESEDPDIAGKFGYIWYRMRKIVIKDLYRDSGWADEPAQLKLVNIQESLRHEILHGFLYESGLAECSLQYSGGWSKNEEMVDWFALQAPKIFETYKQAGCI